MTSPYQTFGTFSGSEFKFCLLIITLHFSTLASRHVNSPSHYSVFSLFFVAFVTTLCLLLQLEKFVSAMFILVVSASLRNLVCFKYKINDKSNFIYIALCNTCKLNVLNKEDKNILIRIGKKHFLTCLFAVISVAYHMKSTSTIFA